MTFAPIMVSVYNRESHFIKCIESLKKCKYADESHIYIAIDAPYRDEDIYANNRIINYSKNIFGFKEITLIIREKNYGVHLNRSLARNTIFEKYDRLIMFEDDNIFSEDFLNFMNNGLDAYFNRKDIFSINGYNYPIAPEYYNDLNIYLWQGSTAWGAGIWRDKWNSVNMNVDSGLKTVKHFLKNYPKVFQLNSIANHYLPALLLMQEKQKLHGDGFISLHHFLNNMYSVFPVESRVRNIGHDGSGINCAHDVNEIYSIQPVYNGISDKSIFDPNVMPNRVSNDLLYKHFKTSTEAKFKSFVRLLFHNLGIIKYFK